MKKNNLIKVLLIILPLAVGFLSFLITKENMDLYSQITVPYLAPPKWLFPIAWTMLYLLMGIASAIVYNSEGNNSIVKIGLLLYFIQLIFNFAWSIIFFNMKSYLFAFVWLVILWLLVLAMTKLFKEVSKSAYLMNIPYLCWLTFAGYLNLAIYILN